jgi:3-keto-5-aminohexanoate cleavage enzyme
MSSKHPEPLIINLAPTGMVPTKDQTPHVPLSPEEIVEDVDRCRALGVSIVHVHARDEEGRPTHRREYFAEVIEGIRRLDPELIVCATCSGRYVTDPDMASLTVGSNNFKSEASVNPPHVIQALAERMTARGIKPELEVFEPGMLHYARYLCERSLIEEPCYVNVLLGSLGTSPASPGSLGTFLALMPESWTWAVAGIGSYQLEANLLGIGSGGHVRVGLEDNIWWDRARTELATNHMLVERVARIAELAERPIATPREVRERLGLPIPRAVSPTAT